MENPKPGQEPTSQTMNPPPAPAPAPPTPSLPLPPQSQNNSSKKRPFDGNGSIQDSTYFKMRALLLDLRPHFIEVLRTPDFRNCKAAQEIREQVKVLMDLYTQMTGNNVQGSQTLTTENRDGQKLPDSKPKEHPYADQRFSKPSDNNKPFQSGFSSDKQPLEDDGKFVVGGSAFGWNFITFPGNEPVYYGRTKETFRAAQVSLQAQ